MIQIVKKIRYNTNEQGNTGIRSIPQNKSRYIQSIIILITNFKQVVHTNVLGCQELAP